MARCAAGCCSDRPPQRLSTSAASANTSSGANGFQAGGSDFARMQAARETLATGLFHRDGYIGDELLELPLSKFVMSFQAVHARGTRRDHNGAKCLRHGKAALVVFLVGNVVDKGSDIPVAAKAPVQAGVQ